MKKIYLLTIFVLILIIIVLIYLLTAHKGTNKLFLGKNEAFMTYQGTPPMVTSPPPRRTSFLGKLIYYFMIIWWGFIVISAIVYFIAIILNDVDFGHQTPVSEPKYNFAAPAA